MTATEALSAVPVAEPVPADLRVAVLGVGLMGADHAARLAGIQAPTLVLWGDRDGIFPRAEQELLVETIPDARLVVYPDTGHALHWERPERFARDLEEFIRHPKKA